MVFPEKKNDSVINPVKQLNKQKGRKQDIENKKNIDPKNIEAAARLHNAILLKPYKDVKEFCRIEGFTYETVTSHIQGRRGINAAAAKRYARVLPITAEELMFGAAETQPTVGIPLIAIASAGLFMDAFATVLKDPELIPAPADAITYRGARAFAVRLATPDMDKRFAVGSVLLCVDPNEADIAIKDGHIVYVTRETDVGTEHTIRLVREVDANLWLFPDSNSPRFHEPWPLTGSAKPFNISIKGIAFSSIQPIKI